jgi:hypothetical protein
MAEGQGQYVLIIREIEDLRVRYLTAKKLAQLFREVPFSEWKTRLDSGGGTVVMRADTEAELTSYRRSIEMLGGQADILDQKTIGGAQVF